MACCLNSVFHLLSIDLVFIIVNSRTMVRKADFNRINTTKALQGVFNVSLTMLAFHTVYNKSFIHCYLFIKLLPINYHSYKVHYTFITFPSAARMELGKIAFASLKIVASLS